MSFGQSYPRAQGNAAETVRRERHGFPRLGNEKQSLNAQPLRKLRVGQRENMTIWCHLKLCDS